MTDEEKLGIVIQHLTGVIDSGYPGDYVWIGDTLAYTSSRGDAFSDLKYDSQLGTITKQEMLDWFDRAVKQGAIGWDGEGEFTDDEIKEESGEFFGRIPSDHPFHEALGQTAK